MTAPVPVLGCTDPLPRRPSRVLVAGTSGSGKTTLATRVSQDLGIPHVEIDALFHGPGWTRRDDFEADVLRFSSQPAWVSEWQYREVRALLAGRTDLVVWLDLSRVTVMRQLVVRTLTRRLRRDVLWNGNTEPPLRTILTDRDHIIRWGWSTHHKSAARVASLAQQRPDLPVVRLRSRRAARRWVAGPLADAADSSGRSW